MTDQIGAFSEYMRRFKPRTLGGRIFMIMMVGGVIIAGISSIASKYISGSAEPILWALPFAN